MSYLPIIYKNYPFIYLPTDLHLFIYLPTHYIHTYLFIYQPTYHEPTYLLIVYKNKYVYLKT